MEFCKVHSRRGMDRAREGCGELVVLAGRVGSMNIFFCKKEMT